MKTLGALSSFCISAFVLAAGSAQAATMAFDALTLARTYTEDGITADAGDYDLGSLTSNKSAHMDDGGTGYAREIAFTMDRQFDAKSFDIAPSSSDYMVCTDDGTTYDCSIVPFKNLRVSGYLNGTQVAQALFDMFEVAGHVKLGADFRDLDQLVIGFAPIPFTGVLVDEPPIFSFVDCLDSPCTHFNLDNVTLAPVPLPASGILFGIGAATLLLVRRRRTPS